MRAALSVSPRRSSGSVASSSSSTGARRLGLRTRGMIRIVHVTDAVLAPLREPVRLAGRASSGRRGHRAGVLDRDLQPGAHARRDALHPRPGRPPRLDPQAAVRRRDLAAARRRHQAGRGFRGRGGARGARGDRPAGSARALPRRDAGAFTSETRDLHWRTHVFLARTDRRCLRRATPTRSPVRAGARSTS